MYQTPVRSTTASTAKSVLTIVAILSLLVSLFAVVAEPVRADGDDSPEACETAINVDSGDPGQSGDSVSYTAPAGEVVTAVCIKSGDDAFGSDNKHSDLITADGTVGGGCYTVAGLGTATVTVTSEDSSACKGISHVDVVTGPGEAECIPASNFTDLELRNMLLGAGSNVDDPQIATGSTATSWGATVNVPDELCDVVVSFTSYTLPNGFMQPFDEQVMFDNLTGTYLAGTSTVIGVDLPYPCGWQVDLYIGDVIATLNADFGHPGDRLIDWSANETGEVCGGEAAADVRIEKTPDEDPQAVEDNDVTAGEPMTFTLTVYNDGDAAAEDVMTTDDLPGAGWSVVAASTTLTDCAIANAGGDESLACGPDEIGAGSSKQVTVTKTAVFGECGQIENTATATPSNAPADSDMGTITVKCASVSLEKTPDGDAVNAGDAAAFTITVTNNDVGEARGVMVTDDLPIVANGWTVDAAMTTLVNCAIAGDAGAQQTLTCGPTTLGGINAPSNSDTVRLVTTTTPDDCGVLDNEAFVTTENDGSDDDTGDITVLCEQEEEGDLEVIKLFCPTEGDDAIFVFGPLEEEPVDLRTLGQEEELPDDEGCTLGAPSEEALGATFTITGGDLAEPLVVQTTWDEILTLGLAPGSYEIVEEGTGLSATFEIVADGDTAVVVFNFLGEEEEEGNLKILKFFCEGDSDVVFTIADGDAGIADVELPADCQNPTPGDADFTLNDGETDSAVFDLGTDGARLIPLAAGAYTLTEVDPNDATSDEFAVTAGETTTVIVFDFEREGTAGGNPPNEGTLGGNPPLPNTALDLGSNGTVPAALLALLMLSGLGAAGYAAHAEARRRR